MTLAFKIGCDPEVFVERDGKFESAYGLIKGDKANPTPVKFGAVQVDGMALEFNIDPANTEQEFVHNVQTVLEQLKKMVPSYRVLAVPVAHFGHEYIKEQPPEATELGCNPDYSAYTGMENPRPNADNPFRTGAGHVHIGWTNNHPVNDVGHFNQCINVTKQLDVFLGIPSVIFDNETERRKMYGAAGAFRPKPYGVEYRVLSNAWVANERLQRWVYRATINGLNELVDGNHLYKEIGDDVINAIINKSDVAGAWEIINKYGLLMPEA